ncbi:MAG: DUF2764 family protein [Bacteroidota bacterium]
MTLLKTAPVYHCLVAGLPTLKWEDEQLPLGQQEFKSMLQQELAANEYEVFLEIYLPYDNRNLLNRLLYSRAAFMTLGNLSEPEILEGIKRSKSLPGYMTAFLEFYEANKENDLHWENELLRFFYSHLKNSPSKLLQSWTAFQQQHLNVLAAWNCRKFTRPLAEEVVVLEEDDWAEKLLLNQSSDFGLSGEFSWLPRLLEIYQMTQLVEREYALDSLRWNQLEELAFFETFGLDALIVYGLKLQLLSRWQQFDQTYGQHFLQRLSEEVAVQVPELTPFTDP